MTKIPTDMQEWFKEEADRIRERLTDSVVVGIPFDWDNEDLALFAVYHLGRQDELEARFKKERERMEELFG